MNKSKQNLITYIHAPCSPGIKGLHIMLFNTLQCLEEEYNIYILCRSRECYDYYMDEFHEKHPNMKIIEPVLNQIDSTYRFGMIEDQINKTVDGQIDKVFWFFPGMVSVTPEEMIKDVYDKLIRETYKHSSVIQLEKETDGPVVQQAEMLYSIIKHNPHFVYRIGDYTEPHLERIINYPMTLVSFYPNEELGHSKIHDSELFHFSEPIEDAEKIYDFIFGYTVEIPERAYLSDFCFEHIKQNDKVKLFVKDKYYSKYAPINTQINSDEYFDLLRYTKFSLIAPSTDPKEVSVNRIYEDISRKCVPIFMKDVQYWKAFDDELNAFIRDNLVYDEEKYQYLNDFIDTLDYQKLIDGLFNCKLIKQFKIPGWLQKQVLDEVR